jgi:hypothetical protein
LNPKVATLALGASVIALVLVLLFGLANLRERRSNDAELSGKIGELRGAIDVLREDLRLEREHREILQAYVFQLYDTQVKAGLNPPAPP